MTVQKDEERVVIRLRGHRVGCSEAVEACGRRLGLFYLGERLRPFGRDFSIQTTPGAGTPVFKEGPQEPRMDAQ